ncbi:uncharacterized protein LOC123409814 [Hordeum vulgare subsp. vulgare]|uniref:uncharacterized protein LOC123409814 n=1 Tax=Hordeum vulgare subsp. vulgare TaxID=112509 RepID=UPI000295A8CB|nr:uncharacterized protein LOC123409814 [Hordeum vulgare subsp. vulgare]
MLAVPSSGCTGGWHVSRAASVMQKKKGKSYRQGKATPFFQVSLSPSKSVFGGGGYG